MDLLREVRRLCWEEASRESVSVSLGSRLWKRRRDNEYRPRQRAVKERVETTETRLMGRKNESGEAWLGVVEVRCLNPYQLSENCKQLMLLLIKMGFLLEATSYREVSGRRG